MLLNAQGMYRIQSKNNMLKASLVDRVMFDSTKDNSMEANPTGHLVRLGPLDAVESALAEWR